MKHVFSLKKKNETCIFLLKKINFFIYHLFIQASEFISCYNLIFRIDVGRLSIFKGF